MKARRRVLFVDDDPMVLEGLQRSMRPMRAEWEILGASGGIEALEIMGRAPVDVVVSDIRMPSMNGAQLLAEVMRRHPGTVRMALSGYADQSLILQCVGSAHQFLSKPLDPASLRSAIRRAMELDTTLPSDRLQSLVARLDRLPSLPPHCQQILRLLRQPESNLQDVAEIIARDVAMTAGILKVVNSAFFGLARQVSNTFQAVEILGVETVKTLALTVKLFESTGCAGREGIDLAALQRHSYQTAAVARAIAFGEGVEGGLVEEVLAVGLLHDVGKLVLAIGLTNEYSAVVRACHGGDRPLCEVELDLLGATHADVGAYLLGLWGLPSRLVEAVRFHHRPRESSVQGFSALTVVHVADWLVHQHPGEDGEICGAPLDVTYLESMKLRTKLSEWAQLGSTCSAGLAGL